jgi:type VI protein secretion system component Hcp
MRKRYVAALGLALAAGVAAQSRASIYLEYPGINGPVAAPGFAGDIQLLDFALADSRAISSPTGGSTDRESSAPKFSDVSMDANGSSASVQLLQASVEGEGQSVKMFITQPFGKNPNQTFAEWDFSNAMISSYSTGSAGGVPVDHFTLNFTAFTYTWTNYDSVTGAQTGTVKYGYDMATAKSTIASEGDTSGFSLVSAVPEPLSAGVFALGLPLLLRRRRRTIAL